MKKNLTNNIILKILSVIFAIMLWLVVINLEDPEKTSTFRGIPVTVLNDGEITGNAQVYEITSGETASVTVTGPRSIVDALSSGDFVAEADFKDISQTNAIPVTVKLSANNVKYENKLNIMLITNTMRVKIEKIISKEFDIEAEYKGHEAANHQLSDPKLSVNAVTVTAPESVIASIEKVKAIADINELNTDLNADVMLTFYNAAGRAINIDNANTSLSIKSVNMTAEMLIIKEVSVRYNINENQIHNAVVLGHHADKETVKIIGREEYISDISEVTVPQTMLNVAGISQTTDYQINVSDILPEHVYPCTGYEIITVTVDVEPIISRVFRIDIANVMIGKIPDGFEASIESNEQIEVELRARKTFLDELNVEELIPYVDLSSAVEGENSVKLQMTLPKGVEESGTVNINVNLTKKTGETGGNGNDETGTTEENTENNDTIAHNENNGEDL